jgi:hypothetical protein
MKISRSLALYVVMLCLILLGAASAWSQTNFSVKIYAEDGSGWKDSVIIGKYTSATDPVGWPATGDSINATLVENELPPVPPSGANQAPDLRIITPPAGGTGYGQGVGVDIRHLVTDGQSNVYRISFRRSDPEGSAITLSWPAGLGSVSGGGFFLTDGLGGSVFPTVDMTAQTSFLMPSSPFDYNALSGGFVDIVVGDGRMMRTFTPDSISLAVDQKGKMGKYEKAKPISNDFQITLHAPARPEGAEHLYIEYSMVVEGTMSFPGNGHSPQNFSGLKKYIFDFTPPLDSAQMVQIVANGNKGKAIKGKYYFYNDALIKLDKKAKAAWTTDYQILRLPFPNVNNIGDEIYVQGANLGVGLTSQVGTNVKGKPIFRSVSVPKWKDVTKTLWKLKKPTVFMMSEGPAQCLDTINSKENIKLLKSIDPIKITRYKGSPTYGNKLLAEILALKFNIAISEKGHTPATGFGDLLYTNDGHPFDGKSVNQIALSGDSALSCWGGLPDGWSYQDMANFLETLNMEFSGPFDTVSWSGSATVATGIKPVAMSGIFTSAGATYAPVAPADYSSLYDVPDVFSLSQNYPNPFNPTTTIEFTIPDDAIVTLKVYNMLGQEVATLADHEEFSSGQNWVELDGAKMASGVYYYRISVNDGQYKEVRKMVLMK